MIDEKVAHPAWRIHPGLAEFADEVRAAQAKANTCRICGATLPHHRPDCPLAGGGVR